MGPGVPLWPQYRQRLCVCVVWGPLDALGLGVSYDSTPPLRHMLAQQSVPSSAHSMMEEEISA